ncbi:MAG: hypothetical protein Q4E78_01665 [Eubacteriales bacterium]|nr:hypothetical protein [Eubacteriales bacterium]
MINKKYCITGMVTILSILTLTGCSTMVKNPMKYILSQEETVQDNSDSDNDNASESADDNKEDNSNSDSGIRVYGTEDITDYSLDGMLATAKDINSDMNNNDVKGIVFVINNKYSEDVRYFLSLTIKDDKPLVIIPYDYNNGNPEDKVTQAKNYIEKLDNKTTASDNQLPAGMIVNTNGDLMFDINDVNRFVNVDIVYDYAGIDADTVYKNMYLNDGTVIISSTGNGELTDEISEVVSGKNAGIVVVSCSKDIYMKGGFTDYGDNVYYTDLSPSKARIMLALLLGNNSDSDTFKNAFTRRSV